MNTMLATLFSRMNGPVGCQEILDGRHVDDVDDVQEVAHQHCGKATS